MGKKLIDSVRIATTVQMAHFSKFGWLSNKPSWKLVENICDNAEIKMNEVIDDCKTTKDFKKVQAVLDKVDSLRVEYNLI